MVTMRDYLVGLNLAKPGRGKFSAAAHEALAKARAEGMIFDEPVKPVKVDKPKTVSTDVAVEDVKTVPTQTVALKNVERPAARNFGGMMVEAPPRYMHSDYIATDTDGSKIKKTFRDICCGCQYSIRWCRCSGGPTIFSVADTVTVLRLSTVGKAA